ncbi:MAG: hypothetical protein HQL91_12615 [Magnetococcales bacterium]|nr:hypothetical protein [Magnetococcales bacterium]
MRVSKILPRLLTLLTLMTLPVQAEALERTLTTGEQEIIRDLATLKAGQNAMNQRFEDINKRFEDMNKRFEDINKRMEDNTLSLNKRIDDLGQSLGKRIEDLSQSLGKRIDDLSHSMLTLFGSLLGIITAFIGFILWDRRTMMKPFEEKLKANHIQLQEKSTLLDQLLAALRELAREDPKLSAVLRNFSLL